MAVTPALKLGKNYRLQVGDGAGTEVFTSILGEQSLIMKTNPDQIPADSKDDGDYKARYYGQQEVTISVSGVTKIPDVALSRLDTQRKVLGSTVNIQIVDTAASNAVKWLGSVSVGSFTANFENKSAVSYQFELAANAAPTTDTLYA